MIARYQAKAGATIDDEREGRFFLARLNRIVGLLPPRGAGFDGERLLRWALFSTYVDCREAGQERAAQDILRNHERFGG